MCVNSGSPFFEEACEATSTVKWDGLAFGAFPGYITRFSFPYPYLTIYSAQVSESDKKSKVWLSDLFELQEFLISFLILLLVEDEEKRLWVERGQWRGKPVIEPTVMLTVANSFG